MGLLPLVIDQDFEELEQYTDVVASYNKLGARKKQLDAKIKLIGKTMVRAINSIPKNRSCYSNYAKYFSNPTKLYNINESNLFSGCKIEINKDKIIIKLNGYYSQGGTITLPPLEEYKAMTSNGLKLEVEQRTKDVTKKLSDLKAQLLKLSLEKQTLEEMQIR